MVVDSRLNAVARINEQTGWERTIISDATTGSGPMFQYLGNIAVEATGALVTVDVVRKAVFRIIQSPEHARLCPMPPLGVGRPFSPP